jgi:hypothetical protein
MNTFFDSLLDGDQQQPPPPPPPPPSSQHSPLTPQEAEQALDDFMSTFLDPVPRLIPQEPVKKPHLKPVSLP